MDFTYFWILGTMLMLIHQHQGESSSIPGPYAEKSPPTQLRHTAHRREKRCSCENQKDKECIFFCHIGIVWVNTPSHVVPYGFGSVRLRRDLRRNLSRCLCKHKLDRECDRFCSIRPTTEEDNGAAKRMTSTQHQGQRSAFWEKRSRHALKPHT